MLIGTFNAYLIVPQPQATTRSSQSAPRAAATTGQDAQAADVAVPPTPPATPREWVITSRNGQRTVIGMPNPNDIIPQQVVDISIAFFLTMAVIIIGLPLARAFARRMDRKSGGTAQIPTEVTAQLGHLSQAVDAIAVEVERISEGQRFTTRLLSEQRGAARDALPSGTNR
jgi:hypothetical protein